MGTLFDQAPRGEAGNIRHFDGVESVLRDLEHLTGKTRAALTADQALGVLRLALDRERFAYWRNDLDIKDEQFAGFGCLLRDIADRFNDLELIEQHVAGIGEAIDVLADVLGGKS